MTSKTALVTGGTAGLGKAMVDQLVDEGWNVVSVDRDKPTSSTHTHIKADLSNREVIDALPAKLEKYSPFDLVVFNAGISATGKFEEMPNSAYEKLMRLNTEGPMVLASQLAASGMMNAQSNITFISSLSHFTGYPGAAVYAAGKDAIAIYAKSIRKPFSKLGIRVGCAYPGPLKTEHAARYSPQGSSDEKRMDAAQAARIVLSGIQSSKHTIFTGMGAKAVSIAGMLFPSVLTFVMRKALFEKLDKNVF